MKASKHLVLSLLVAGTVVWAQSSPAPGWEYRLVVTGEGTRSEGRIGHLLYDGVDIGSRFGTIIISGTLYRYRERVHPWDSSGYIEDEDAFRAFRKEHGIRGLMNKAMRDRGWYTGGDRKWGTPRSWVYVRSGALDGYCSPGKLAAFGLER